MSALAGAPLNNLEPLSTLRASPGRFNVLAVVSSFTLPRPTRGTDFACNLYVVDQSCHEGITPGLVRGFEVLIFARKESSLPRLRQVGDLVYLHSVQCTSYKKKLQLLAKVGPAQEGGWSLYNGNEDDAMAYQSSAHTVPKVPLQQLNQLRKFDFSAPAIAAPSTAALPRCLEEERKGQGVDTSCRVSLPSAARPQRSNEKEDGQQLETSCRTSLPRNAPALERIEGMKEGQHVNISCRVVGTYDENPADRRLWIWDGTDAFPHHPRHITQQSKQADAQPSSASGWPKLHRRLPSFQSKWAVEDFPFLGSAVPIEVPNFEDRNEQATKKCKLSTEEAAPSSPPELPALGSWIKLSNIQVVSVEGQVQGLYGRQSRWEPLPDQSDLLSKFLSRVADNQISRWAPQDNGLLQAHFVAKEEEGLPLAPLRQILIEAATGEEKLYKCLVRVICHRPKQTANFCRSSRPGRPLEFKLKLCLQDATAELDAKLLGEHGCAFFMGCPPQDLSNAAHKVPKLLQAYMNHLEGISTNRKEGVWMECGLRRCYPTKSLERNARTARYEIENTVLNPAAMPASSKFEACGRTG